MFFTYCFKHEPSKPPFQVSCWADGRTSVPHSLLLASSTALSWGLGQLALAGWRVTPSREVIGKTLPPLPKQSGVGMKFLIDM